MIYLEPRSKFDSAIVSQEDGVVYRLSMLIDILMEMGMDYSDAMDYYCYNIESLCSMGLIIEDDLCEEQIEEESISEY